MTRPPLPLKALRAFEAAARRLSISGAAAELNVTPAAVSHQIKALEQGLGFALFHRRPRGVTLTAAGEAALPFLSEGFGKLAQGLEQARAQSERAVLSISVGPSFGAMWLTPRLERFRRRHPEIEIRIDGTDDLADFAAGAVDVALRYGAGRYDGLRSDLLFRQINTPVCSPALLDGDPPLRAPSDLSRHTLLHIDWKDDEPTWRAWLRAAGAPEVDPGRGPRFSLESMAVQAARDGQGVALVAEALVADDVAAGRLVRPFGPRFSTPLSVAYYLLCTAERADAPKIAAFRAWVLGEAHAPPHPDVDAA